jgi:hypothetical protein
LSVLQVAHAYEQAQPYTQRKSPLLSS